MRTTHELLQILYTTVLEYQRTEEKLGFGLCAVLARLYEAGVITQKEMTLVAMYITLNMPYYEDISETAISTAYGWPQNWIEPRLKWLEEHIDITHS